MRNLLVQPWRWVVLGMVLLLMGAFLWNSALNGDMTGAVYAPYVEEAGADSCQNYLSSVGGERVWAYPMVLKSIERSNIGSTYINGTYKGMVVCLEVADNERPELMSAGFGELCAGDSITIYSRRGMSRARDWRIDQYPLPRAVYPSRYTEYFWGDTMSKITVEVHR